MPRMTLGGGYMPGPVGAEDFIDEQEEIKRRRAQLAEILKPNSGLTGVAGGISNLALGLARGFQNSQLRDQEKDLAIRRSAAAQEWLNRRPPDTPAQDEVVGTGPIAPPPGTPGVEETGGGRDVMNTPEPGPNAPASAFSQNAPDTPALWVGKDTMDMVPRGVTDFVPNKAATPFLPAGLNATSKWAMEGAGFGPAYAALATHAMNKSIDTPIELEKKRQEVLAKKEAAAELARTREHELELKRIETARLATDKAAETRANQEARAADRRNELDVRAIDKAEAAAEKAAAASKQNDKDEKEITAHTVKYGEALKKEKIPQLDLALKKVEAVIAQYSAKKEDVPGVGVISSNLPVFDEDKVAARAPITGLKNAITVATAGLSQTAAEMRNVLNELGLNWYSSHAAFLAAIPQIRAKLDERKAGIAATYRPEAVERYHTRLAKTRADLAKPVTPEDMAKDDALWGDVKVGGQR